MSRGKAVGIAVLFALALSAFGAGSASAKGTTAYTCVKNAEGDVVGAHCLSSGGGEKYKHVEIAKNETTTLTATNANTASETTAARSAILKTTLSGVATEVTCTGVQGEGTLENKTTGEEMYLHSEGKLKFTGCVVKVPAGKGCKVAGEELATNQLTSTSEGQGDAVKISPKEGTTFTELKIEGCSIEALNGTCPVTGSVKVVGPGATLTATESEVTSQNTVKVAGTKAGLDFAMTIKAHSKEGEATNPISVTTTP